MSGQFSREALRARMGERAFALAEQAAHDAPAPSPEAIERARRLFAPVWAQMARERAADRQPAHAA